MNRIEKWAHLPSMQVYEATRLASEYGVTMNLTTVHSKARKSTEWGECIITDRREGAFHFTDPAGKSHRARYEEVLSWSLRIDLQGTNPEGRE